MMHKKGHSNIATGRLGEEIAVEFLKRNGITIIGNNLRTPYGEIDVLGQEGDCLVFCEVKTRRNNQFGFPENSVNLVKQEHIVQAAIAYLQEKDELDRSWRIDVIAVNLFRSKPPKIEWFKNAING
jgi:putative endonuclease